MPQSASRRGMLAAVSAGVAALFPRQAIAETEVSATPGEGAEGACILTPQAVEGPFYNDPRLVRSDITEGRPGVPLRVRLRVIEAGSCAPIEGARVDIWHCDAQGLYSGYPGQGDVNTVDTSGQTFLRGTQKTDAAGWARFETIYPGWYPGRATHIHMKVFLDARTLLTGQLYFPDALNEFLYTQIPAYGGRAIERAVINANDGIAREQDPDHRAFCAVKEERDRYVASLVIGVDRSAGAVRGAMPGIRPDRPPPPGFGMGPPPGSPDRAGIADRLGALVPGLNRGR